MDFTQRLNKGPTNLLKIVNTFSSKDQTTHSSEDMTKKQKRIFQNRGIFSQTTNRLVGLNLRTLLPTQLTLNNIRLHWKNFSKNIIKIKIHNLLYHHLIQELLMVNRLKTQDTFKIEKIYMMIGQST